MLLQNLRLHATPTPARGLCGKVAYISPEIPDIVVSMSVELVSISIGNENWKGSQISDLHNVQIHYIIALEEGEFVFGYLGVRSEHAVCHDAACSRCR